MALVAHNANILVTGGAGFIGSNFIRYLLSNRCFSGSIINVDNLSYAANLANLQPVENHPRYFFFKTDICDRQQIEKICINCKIDVIIHFAAETHVDNSIKEPIPFVQTNVLGTVCLLEVVRKHPSIHFHHISTDEVYGTLGKKGQFSEDMPYLPNSPYAASKAGSDHFLRAYSQTYQISTSISHCCNNFGPFQYPEKLVPKIIENCIKEKPLPIYSKGENIREWIFVEDHCKALWTILLKGEKWEIYNVGSNWEMGNLEMVQLIIEIFSRMTNTSAQKYLDLIAFVEDRAGHDFRYSLNSEKTHQLGWKPCHTLKEALRKTIAWHLEKVKATCSQRESLSPENLD